MSKKPLFIISTLVLLATGLAVVLPYIRRYQDAQSLAQAQVRLAKSDLKGASLCLRQVLQSQPENLSALKLMASLAEAAQSPQALDLWRRIAELEPSDSNKLSLAQTALRHEGLPLTLASETLHTLQHLAPSSPHFHLLSANLQLRLGRAEEAAYSFESALDLDPANPVCQLNHAFLKLQSTNPVEVAEARSRLLKLSTQSNTGLPALRFLIADSLRSKDLQTAQSYAKILSFDPRATFEDKLQNLAIQKELGYAIDKQLPYLQSLASTNADHACALSAWLIRQGLADVAVRWLESCPRALREQNGVQLAIVDAYVATKDWLALEKFLDPRSWPEMEFLRLAFLSLAATQQKHSLADNYWRRAVRAASDRFGPMLVLSRLARNWGKSSEYEALLWRIVQRFPRERWVFAELDVWYSASSNSQGLYRLYSAMLRSQPTNSVVQNNFATIALLLNMDLAKAHQVASQAFAHNPKHPGIACTYAYSLLVQRKHSEALKLIRELGPEKVMHTPGALYCGIILSQSGDRAEAQRFLKAAAKQNLLPEERALLNSNLN